MKRPLPRIVCLLALIWSCAPTPNRPADSAHVEPRPAPLPTASSSSATTAAPATPDSAGTPRSIEWLRDEPDAAFARAKSEAKLVVVDLWAAWCHTCLSMQRFVLTDDKLPGAGARFVFLAVDTDRESNAEFLRRFPTAGWPTFYVLSAEREVRGRWLGAASPGQFARFLADAEHAGEPATDGELVEADALRTQADGLAAEGRYQEAAARYADALGRAPQDWARAPDVRVARASALKRSGDAARCVELAFDPTFGESRAPISTSDLSAHVLECAEHLPEGDPRRRRAREVVAARLAALCGDGASELTPDDRGDACGNLIDARTSLGDAAGARAAAETRLRLLEDAARGMPDDVALIYDAARADTLVALGRAADALALLEARERALPDNYNPPHHRARILKQLGRYDEGLTAIERALALSYGPRHATLMSTKVDLLLGAGRRTQARAVLLLQVDALAALPEGERRPEAERAARERLRALDGRH